MFINAQNSHGYSQHQFIQSMKLQSVLMIMPVDESVGSEVGSAIDVVDGVEGLQILVELLIAPIFPVGSLLRQRDNCPNHLTLLLTNWI